MNVYMNKCMSINKILCIIICLICMYGYMCNMFSSCCTHLFAIFTVIFLLRRVLNALKSFFNYNNNRSSRNNNNNLNSKTTITKTKTLCYQTINNIWVTVILFCFVFFFSFDFFFFAFIV